MIPINVQLLNSIEVIETIGMKSNQSILETKFVKAVLDDARNQEVGHIHKVEINVLIVSVAGFVGVIVESPIMIYM